MNTREIYQVLDYLIIKIENSRIITTYTQLINVSKQLVSTNNTAHAKSFRDLKKTFKNFYDGIHKHNFRDTQLTIFTNYVQESTLSKKEIEEINDFFEKFEGDYQQIINILNKNLVKIKNFYNATIIFKKQILLLNPKIAEENKEPSIEIIFKNQNAYGTLNSLDKSIKIWNKIIRSFLSFTVKDSPEDIKVRSIKEGSFILELTLDSNTVITILGFILSLVSLIESHNKNIQEKEKEIKDEKYKKLLKEQITIEHKIMIHKFSILKDEIINELSSEVKNIKREIEEMKIGLYNSMDDIFKFIIEGNKINAKQIENKKVEKQDKELNKIASKVNSLPKIEIKNPEIFLLGSKKEDSNNK